MKSVVVKAFYDAQDPARTVYQIGDAFEGTQKRVKDLEKRGFVKSIEEPKPKKVKKG